MSMSLNARSYAEQNINRDAFLCCKSLKHVQFCEIIDNKTTDVSGNRHFQLFRGFVITMKMDATCRESCLKGCIQFTLGDYVKR
ncbi:hypothetical protein D3C78_1475040 [compost metagenome]